ncbi:hypothetical protein CGRA01v4_07979 [Colletotrichum graminicola]|uniref:WSC domain-containing protein n=1 Tax=Colletotrichum graminicola (strain M1.001 / M2 / FGSC 10212) TaxID=645133 RepID=E3Q7X0_COLGM|nr:uncharacterized protein GLRG_02153 [Colletotrichum graminicola M1.001]EFQ26982.1 hypothetical protein GLRG_02153 [Colletotrichum graminicola M1.001]WDK16696.1 hypothetical protein CGRA01v4_07979 [Colletotrichum graminicola]
MTPQKCIAMVQGQRYAGVIFDTCYGSQSLDATAFILGDSCSIPCPGDARQICGGNAALNSNRLRMRHNSRALVLQRDASTNILLTIFQLIVLPGTTVVESGATIVVQPTTIADPAIKIPTPSLTAVVPPVASLPGLPAGTNVQNAPAAVIGPGGTVNTTNGQPTSALRPALIPSPLSPNSAITSVVTTVTYMIVDPTKPTALVPVELCTTLYFEDCQCPTQVIPTLPMATYVADCDKCGVNGQSKVTITAPSVEPYHSPSGNR